MFEAIGAWAVVGLLALMIIVLIVGVFFELFKYLGIKLFRKVTHGR